MGAEGSASSLTHTVCVNLLPFVFCLSSLLCLCLHQSLLFFFPVLTSPSRPDSKPFSLDGCAPYLYPQTNQDRYSVRRMHPYMCLQTFLRLHLFLFSGAQRKRKS